MAFGSGAPAARGMRVFETLQMVQVYVEVIHE